MRAQARVRIRVADLMIWVLVVGVAVATIRAATAVAKVRATHDIISVLGLGAALLAILMAGVLVRQLVDRNLRPVPAHLPAVVWRLTVVGLLGAALAIEMRFLESTLVLDWWGGDLMRPHLLPLALTSAVGGLAAALSPPMEGRERSIPTTARICAWTAFAFAASIMAAMTQMELIYLYLQAVEGMRLAMPPAIAQEPVSESLHARALHAGLLSLPVLACWVGLAVLSARRPGRLAAVPHEVDVSVRGLKTLIAMTAATAAGVVWLAGPPLHELEPWLAESLGVAVDPLNAVIAIIGFAGLALVPAARTCRAPAGVEADRAEPRSPLSIRSRLESLAWALIPAGFIVGSALEFVGEVPTAGGLRALGWFGWTEPAYVTLHALAARSRLPYWLERSAGLWLPVGLAQVGVAYRLLALLLVSNAGRPSPIDAQLTGRRTAGVFVTCWAAYTVLLAALLPVSFFAGFALFQLLIRYGA